MPFLRSFIFLFASLSFGQSALAQFGSMPPFTIDIQPVVTTPLPAMHSFAFAKSADKWLIIGGRTNGLHGLNSSGGFPPEYKNDVVTVIDTSTWSVYTADLNQLTQTIADPMRSANMQYIQDGNYLYMVGGYGYDSTVSIFVSYPKLTAIHVDNMINAVINGLPIGPHIRQVADTNLSICGGELGKIGNDYYLMFGHNFGGRYSDPPVGLFTQTYSDRIKKFSLTDDGTTITLSGFTYQVNTNNFHRRDLSTGPIVYPDNSFGIGAYGGVFRKDSNLPFREPIRINSSGVASVNVSYEQVMNHYTCALMPVYDSVTQKMYTTFFGGIGLYTYNDTTSALTRNADVPFIDDISTMTVSSSGAVEETILPEKLPALLGSNAKFVPAGLSSYSNEVIRIRDLPNTKILAGYIYGGIRAQVGNFGSSVANDTVYRVYITPNNFIVGMDEFNTDIQNVQLFPNPSTVSRTLLFSLKSSEKVRITLLDLAGKEITVVADEQLQKGEQKIIIPSGKLSAGIYFCRIKNSNAERTIKFIISN